jgi:hypothetical protein
MHHEAPVKSTTASRLFNMPTVEIVSVGSMQGPFAQPVDLFVQRCDSSLRSDRGLFQETLDHLTGTLIHLGNPRADESDPVWFCGHSIGWRLNNSDNIDFEADAVTELQQILLRMQDQSPEGHVLFLTDYQFGPAPEIATLRSIDELIALMRSHTVRFNTLYSVGMAVSQSRYWINHDGGGE